MTHDEQIAVLKKHGFDTMVSPWNESTWQKSINVFPSVDIQVIIRLGSAESGLSGEIWVHFRNDETGEDNDVLLEDTADLDGAADIDINIVLMAAAKHIIHELWNIRQMVIIGLCGTVKAEE